MREVHEIDHPLVQHKLAVLRDVNTGPKEFRELVEEVAMFLAYEATRDLPLETTTIRTPIAEATARVISGKKLAIIPILRAGLGMVPGLLNLIPMAKVGHLGLYRDPETLEPVEYYAKLPADMSERDALILDPMLATGGSAAKAVSLVKEKGARSVKLLCLIAAPEGIAKLHDAHPDVPIYTTSVDERLDSHSYIVPGLGDAGDRLFGTK